MLHRRRRLIRVMVVVPTLARADDRHKPIVPAMVIGVIVPIAKHVRQRVDGPRHMPHQYNSSHHTPNKNATCQLKSRHSKAHDQSTDQPSSHENRHSMSRKNGNARVRILFQPHVKRVIENISGIFLVQAELVGVRILINQPLKV